MPVKRSVYNTKKGEMPHSDYSGHIEGISDTVRPWSTLVTVHIGDSSQWQLNCHGAYSPAADSFLWRFKGAPLPTVKEQGQTSIVWPWDKAPGELRALSRHGGDEDHVILLPSGCWNEWEWLKEGCCDSRHTINDGRTVIIKAHA